MCARLIVDMGGIPSTPIRILLRLRSNCCVSGVDELDYPAEIEGEAEAEDEVDACTTILDSS
ncbi:MAG: hypothetical protein GY816_07790 [Cytophagales bacterium]|nr:hypothetical protein [Cytophagales bacterium]